MRTASRKRKGLNPADLPPLETLEDAQKWSAVIAKAVATGELSSGQARAVQIALTTWMRAHDMIKLRTRLERMEKLLQQKRGR